ncbi:protein ripply1 isoform X2 [Meles meles]|uniref:protein ripply1 isoform X2 n=1 Tax=Meles meles TaxID=9662 RepID=UPI001E69F911|nr:protein ripply1 isoform X2 [Meles meles]
MDPSAPAAAAPVPAPVLAPAPVQHPQALPGLLSPSALVSSGQQAGGRERLFWPKSRSFDYLYSDGEILLQNFPVQATINLYEDSDIEEEEEEEEKDKEEETEERGPEECVRVPSIPAGPRILPPFRKPDFWIPLQRYQYQIQAKWGHLSEEPCRTGRGHLGTQLALENLHTFCLLSTEVCASV